METTIIKNTESEFCTIKEWCEILEGDLNIPLEEFKTHLPVHGIIEETFTPSYRAYVLEYSGNLVQKLWNYYALIQDIILEKTDQYQEFFEYAKILFDAMGHPRSEDAHRIARGIQDTWNALSDFEARYKNQNLGYKVMQLTCGILPTTELVYHADSVGLNIGCIPVSQKQFMKNQNGLYSGNKLGKYRKIPSCRN